MGRRSNWACEGQFCEGLALESLGKSGEAGDVPWPAARAVYMRACVPVRVHAYALCVLSQLRCCGSTQVGPQQPCSTTVVLHGCWGPTMPHLHGWGSGRTAPNAPKNKGVGAINGGAQEKLHPGRQSPETGRSC